MKRVRIVLWLAVAVAALVGGALYLTAPRPGELPMNVSRPDPDATLSIGGPFELVGPDGATFTQADLEGRPSAVFFGFTHCPDVCPTTLSTLVRLRRDLGAEDAFDIVFITVDPARDGPEEVGQYADLFDSPVIGLTGSEAQIAQAKKSFGVVSQRDGEGEDYDVQHTATVFLMDSNGAFQSTISPEETPAMARAKLERLIG